MSVTSSISLHLEEEDLPYEEEILRHPYQIKVWQRYVDHKMAKRAKPLAVNLIYERALKELPGSYKLWYAYLKFRRRQVKRKCVSDPAYEDVNNTYERALVFMHKMPRIWLDYCQFLTDQKLITRTRRVFDRALRSLPLTQHSRVWSPYVAFAKTVNIPEMAVRVYRRYLKLEHENTEDYIEYLMSVGWLDEAAVKMVEIINKENFVSKNGKSNHQLWHDLCKLISTNPDKVKSIRVADIIRAGLSRFTDGLGQLWCALADVYIGSGLDEKARDVYEEALSTVMTVKDFGQVFDAYTQLEESLIEATLKKTSKHKVDIDVKVDLELKLCRLEALMDKRPLLLSSVLLRQNPHNVNEWLKRVKLYENSPKDMVRTFTEAVQTVDPKQATGKPHLLWVEFARFYESNDQLREARVVMEKGLKVEYKNVDDLALLWCEYAEMELRNQNPERSLQVLRRGTAVPPKMSMVSYYDEREPVQNRVHKSLRLWSFYSDLEENLGTFETTKAVYNRIIDLRIASPLLIISYAAFLEDHKYFEESFKAFERGISLFRWPNVEEIWDTYLCKFVARYKGTKLERARDLFEQALEHCPADLSKKFFYLYGKMEEDYGLARHAMAVYERAVKVVPKGDRFEVYSVYIKKASEMFGVTYTRQIYEQAIEVLGDDQAREMCLRYADLERKLGEIDRARAVYGYASQLCDPRVHPQFWKSWNDFEVQHGNEDTFRDMLRVKRSVHALYNIEVNFAAASLMAAESGKQDEMRKLEESMSVTSQSNLKTTTGLGDTVLEKSAPLTAAPNLSEASKPFKGVAFVRGENQPTTAEQLPQVQNPAEIDLDQEPLGDESSSDGEEPGFESVEVPKEVFGSIKR